MIARRNPKKLRTALTAGLVVAAAATLLPSTASAALKKETWLSGVTITEYFPAPEAWFVGQRVEAPGLSRKSRVDWLYSARGMSMEGDGVGTNGKRYHIENSGSCLLYTSPSPRDRQKSRMPSSA